MLILILLRQIAIMALLILIGLYLSKRGYLTLQGAKDMGTILLRLVIPCVIVKSYMTEYSRERLLCLALSAGLALAGFLLAMLTAHLVYGTRRGIENFAASFCNAGFIGIPLVQAAVGEEGVFYVAASIALLNLFQWTYGVYIMTGDRKAISAKTVLKNPVVAAIAIGLLLFILQIPIPDIAASTVGYIAGMNTPLAMLLLGTYMAKLSPRQMFDRRAYGCVLLRLLVIPAVILLVFWALPIRNQPVALAVYLAAATPVGANICVFAQQYDCDYEFSVVTVCLSTLLSVVTVPAMVLLAQAAL